MEISLKWVNELINIEILQLEKVVEKLTLGGFEVEEIIEKQIDTKTQITLDISATANRSDSLSIHGISAEISALLNQPLKAEKYRVKESNWVNVFKGSAQNLSKNSYCQLFFAVIIENITDVIPPKWLKQKLSYSGVVPKNDLQDFQTYIQLETGYPFELYDFEKISLKSGTQDFSIRLADEGNIKKIFVNNVPISIAGIKPTDDVRCSPTTTKILLEGSVFKAASIRSQSRLVGVRTDRSARYEKSLKDSNSLEACYRLISLLRVANPNLRCKLHTNSSVETSKYSPIVLNYRVIKEVLGPVKEPLSNGPQFILPQQVTEYLTRLKFKQKYDSISQTWKVTIPDVRSTDIIKEIDIVEEVGRLHGFNHFLTQLPQIRRVGIEDPSYKIRKKLTACFLSLGLTECVHYSLVNPQTQKEAGVSLVNPLMSEYSNLRASLLPNLIQTTVNNLKQGNQTIDGFEYGHVFSTNSSTFIHEKEVVAGIFGGTKIKSITWFEAKGRLEQFFEQLKVLVFWKTYNPANQSTILHPYRTTILSLNKNTDLGIFGQINPILAKELNLSSDTYLFELDFEIMKKSLLQSTMIISGDYSLYPKIVKDLSFIVSNDITFETIQETLYLNGSKFLTEVSLLDQYKGPLIPAFHSSLCLQFVFQSDKQTLQNKQVDNIIQNLKEILISKFNVVIRD